MAEPVRVQVTRPQQISVGVTAGGAGGVSYPPGGDAGEVLTKVSEADNDVDWLPGTPGPQGPPGQDGADGAPGTSDHGLLTGLGDDDHAQYLTNARGDARYDSLGAASSGDAAHAGAANPHPTYETAAEVDAKITTHSGQADPHPGYAVDAHTHPASNLDSLTDVSTTGATDGEALVYRGSAWTPETVSSGGGVTDHGALSGLADPDHPIGAVSGLQTALDGKSATSHAHAGVYDPAGTAAAGDTAHTSAPDPHPTYETGAEVDARIATHAGLPDPHPGYLTPTEGNAAYATTGHAHGGVYDPAGTAAAGDTAHTGAADPHPVYETSAEAAAKVTAHEGAVNPHPTYETAAEVAAQITTHAGGADPHSAYLTSAEIRTQQGGKVTGSATQPSAPQTGDVWVVIP